MDINDYSPIDGCKTFLSENCFDSSIWFIYEYEREAWSISLSFPFEWTLFLLPALCLLLFCKKRDLKMRMMKSEQITSKFNNTKDQFILNKTFTWKEENMHRKLLINDSNSIRWSNWISFQNSNWISSTRIHFNCISTFPVHHNLFIKPFDYDITE